MIRHYYQDDDLGRTQYWPGQRPCPLTNKRIRLCTCNTYIHHAPEFSNGRGLIYKLFGPSVFCFSVRRASAFSIFSPEVNGDGMIDHHHNHDHWEERVTYLIYQAKIRHILLLWHIRYKHNVLSYDTDDQSFMIVFVHDNFYQACMVHQSPV
jgi:hypothetical protein